LGGAETGRGLMIGLCRAHKRDLTALFSGTKYAPSPLTPAEEAVPDLAQASQEVRYDCPSWLWPLFEEMLGNNVLPVLEKFQTRAPVFLRVNSAKSDRKTVAELLVSEGVLTAEVAMSPTALEVLEKPRKVAQTKAFSDGLVELQDAASQAIVDRLEITNQLKVLDYCAGGGGKSLAISAHGAASVTAHDTEPLRMKDLPARALRAGVTIVVETLEELDLRKFNLVLCDVPCSGSGSWRRSPDSKWALTPERLDELVIIQSDILNDCRKFVSENGVLAYITCSMFRRENDQQIKAFLSLNPDWKLISEHQFSPLDGGDGFYLAQLTRV
jgi:16S rRNA (cytosine967-C5)-methyltransferase